MLKRNLGAAVARQSLILCGVASGALLASVPALAQTAPSQQGRTASSPENLPFADLVVTARKRDESIMAAPVILQAITSAQIQDRRITDTEQLSQVTPGITILNIPGSAGANVNIRGLNNGFNTGLDPSLQLVLDGASTSASSLYTVGLMDVAQIEVLKGPQSLFYGKGASAGIISIRSADPTRTWEGKLTSSYEFNADEYIADGYVSGPITEDLGIRLALNYNAMEGYFHNPNPDNPQHRNPDGDRIGGRLSLRYNPGGGPLDIRLKYTQLHDVSNFGGNTLRGQFVCTLGRPQIPAAFRDNCKLDDITAGVPNVPPFNPALRTNPFDVAGYQTGSGLVLTGPGGNHAHTDTKFLVANVDYQIWPDLTLSSVSSWSAYDTAVRATGFFGGIQGAYRITGQNRIREYSQELRLTSDFQDSWFNFMIGAYFNRMNFKNQSGFEVPQVAVPGVGTLGLFTENDIGFKDRTRAFFGQVLLTPVESFELALGIRQTRARRYLTTLFARNNYPAFFNPGIAGEGLGFWPDSATDYTENNTSPEATLTYRPNSDFTAFASYKRGYKGPGFRTPGGTTSYTPANAGAGAVAPVKGEKVEGFEGGVKLRALDRTLSVTASVYTYKYKDLQVAFILPSGPGGALTSVLANGANARVSGVELGLDYMPPFVEGLTLSAFVNYNDSHFTQWKNAPCYVGQTVALGCVAGSQNLAGKRLESAPLWSGNLGLDYTHPISDAYRVRVNASAKWSGSYMSNVSYNPNSRQDSYMTADVAVHFGPNDERWDLALITRNITNKYYMMNSVDFGRQTPGVVGDVAAYVNRGRQIAVQGSVQF